MKTDNHFSHKLRIFSLILVCLFLWKIALPQRISELPPATLMVTGDLMPIVQNGVTKKLAFAGLLSSLQSLSDTLFVKYRCHKIKGSSRWYSSGDTIYIDTCHIQVSGTDVPDSLYFAYGCISGADRWYFSGDTILIDTCYSVLPLGSSDSCLFELHGDTIWNKGGYKVMLDDSVYFMRDAIRFMKPNEPLGGFLTLGKLDATGKRQLVMSTFNHDSIEGIKIPLTISDTNYSSLSGSEAVSFINLMIHNDTLFLGSATTRLNDMIYVARTDFYSNSVVINSPSGIYYKSRSYWNMKLNKTMSGAILQSNGTDWYVLGVFFDQYSSMTMASFPDSTSFNDHVQINASIHAPNIDSASTSFQIFYNPLSGLFSYSPISSKNEIDPIFASDSSKIIHWSDTLATANRIVTKDNLADTASAIRSILPTAVGYTLTLGCASSIPGSDGTTWYLCVGNWGSSPGYCRLYCPVAGTITKAYVNAYFGSSCSGEEMSVYVTVNSTNSTLIQAVANSYGQKQWSNTNMNVAVSANDYLTIKLVNPIWATNPSGGTMGAQATVFIQ